MRDALTRPRCGLHNQAREQAGDKSAQGNPGNIRVKPW
jgi:hypothetical protein